MIHNETYDKIYDDVRYFIAVSHDNKIIVVCSSVTHISILFDSCYCSLPNWST